MTPTLSTCAAEKATLRLQAARLSVPDELYWYNNNTHWDSLSRKEFRNLMIRMETITVQFYNDACAANNRSAAIKTFWADEWGCEYLPESGRWLDLATGTFIESESEKKALKNAKKALKKANKEALKKAKKAKNAKKAKQTAQYNDEEEELYAQAALQPQPLQPQQQPLQPQPLQPQPQQQQAYEYDDWYDAEEEAYAEAYASARAQEELKEQQAQQQAQLYLDYTSEEEDEEDEEEERRIACQPVLYIEEHTGVQGDPDWRAFIYYDARIRRYVLKGTRRSLRATSRKTRYPEVKLCFRSSREMARYLRSSTDATMNVTMFAMAGATARDATFAELYALPPRGYKTELFGYDDTRPCYSTFVDYLCMLRDVDAAHSNFAAF